MIQLKNVRSAIQKYLGIKKMVDIQKQTCFDLRRYQMIEHILYDKEKGITDNRYLDQDIIVSLTTYGKRINDVSFTIESIMQQSMKANKIILWLDYGFKNMPLPHALSRLQQRGLIIDYCKDIRSYKKLIPALQKYPKDTIITVDDDVIYDYDVLEHLIMSYIKDPSMIHACRVRKIKRNTTSICPYNEWNLVTQTGSDFLYIATGAGGILYPPNSLDPEVLNEDVFMDICQTADDIWFKSMSLKRGVIVNKVYTRNSFGNDYITNSNMQVESLAKINTKGDLLNDKQLKAVFNKYNLYGFLR
jgi:hypothetical protein